ncbi:hypothetical protein T4E_3492 [Trichinella pseudospiralis]|uniref:Uncharacterized protein n=1 Tax=Trichinella pseudospiralis TaxID=6337 RepID=A0A0V0YL09_TRIPS|nr:hypothetical protein T4E_3492 [Trichinella pseudospiralis]
MAGYGRGHTWRVVGLVRPEVNLNPTSQRISGRKVNPDENNVAKADLPTVTANPLHFVRCSVKKSETSLVPSTAKEEPSPQDLLTWKRGFVGFGKVLGWLSSASIRKVTTDCSERGDSPEMEAYPPALTEILKHSHSYCQCSIFFLRMYEMKSRTVSNRRGFLNSSCCELRNSSKQEQPLNVVLGRASIRLIPTNNLFTFLDHTIRRMTVVFCALFVFIANRALSGSLFPCDSNCVQANIGPQKFIAFSNNDNQIETVLLNDNNAQVND